MRNDQRSTWPKHSVPVLCSMALLLVSAMGGGSVLCAQDGSQTTERTAVQMMSDQWIVLARTALGTQGAVLPEQLTMASVLMDQALQLNPGNAENWRMRWELAKQMNDSAAVKIALRRYTDLVPEDDQAQYAWVMNRLAELESIPDRIAASERILTGKSASQFSPALRSRLATFVASASGELGDVPKQLQWLKTASALDPSNIDAARMIYQAMLARQRPAGEIGNAMLKVVEAQPFEAYWRNALGDMLASQAAYRLAAMQYRNAQVLGRSVQNPLELYPWVLCLAASGRTEEAMKLLEDIEMGWNPPKKDLTMPNAPAPAPVGLGLPTDLRILRLAILRGTGKLTLLESGLDQLIKPSTATAPASTQENKTNTATTAPATEPATNLEPADVVWLELLFDRQIPHAQAWLEQAEANATLDIPLLQRMKGWLALRQKQNAKAREILMPIANKDVFASLGLALTMTSPQESTGRMVELKKIITAAPVSLAAYLAQQAWTQAGFTAQTLTPDGEELSKIVEHWPSWMASPNPRITPVVQVSLHIDNTRLGFLEPIVGWIGVRNLTEVPMAVVSGGPVPTAGVLVFSPRRMPEDQKTLPPVVLDVSRRIRIEPRTEYRVPVRMDLSQAGIIFANRPFDSFAFSTTAILGPIFDGKTFRVGPLGASDSVTLVDRRGQGSSIATLDNIARNLGGSENPELFTAMATLLQALPRLCTGPDAAKDPECSKRIADAICQRFAVGSPQLQAWSVRFLPKDPVTIPLLQPIHDVAMRSKDPLMGVAYLAVMVHDDQSPQIDAAMRSGDEKLGQFAKALRATLKNTKPATTQP